MVYALIGIPELLLIVAIVFLFFGGSKLPGLARALGGAVRAFRSGNKETPDHIEVEPEPPEEQKVGEKGSR